MRLRLRMAYKTLLLLLATLTSSLLLPGCWFIPISKGHMPVEPDEVRLMLGSSTGEVENRFGCPNWELRDTEYTYYIYETRAHTSEIIMLFYIPIWWESAESEGKCEGCEWADEEYTEESVEALHCVMLEFDRDGVLRRYKTRVDRDWGQTLQGNCKHSFFTNEELNSMDHTLSCGKQ